MDKLSISRSALGLSAIFLDPSLATSK